MKPILENYVGNYIVAGIRQFFAHCVGTIQDKARRDRSKETTFKIKKLTDSIAKHNAMIEEKEKAAREALKKTTGKAPDPHVWEMAVSKDGKHMGLVTDPTVEYGKLHDLLHS